MSDSSATAAPWEERLSQQMLQNITDAPTGNKMSVTNLGPITASIPDALKI